MIAHVRASKDALENLNRQKRKSGRENRENRENQVFCQKIMNLSREKL